MVSKIDRNLVGRGATDADSAIGWQRELLIVSGALSRRAANRYGDVG